MIGNADILKLEPGITPTCRDTVLHLQFHGISIGFSMAVLYTGGSVPYSAEF